MPIRIFNKGHSALVDEVESLTDGMARHEVYFEDDVGNSGSYRRLDRALEIAARDLEKRARQSRRRTCQCDPINRQK